MLALWCYQNFSPDATSECMANRKYDCSLAEYQIDVHFVMPFLLSPRNKCRMSCLWIVPPRMSAPYPSPSLTYIPDINKKIGNLLLFTFRKKREEHSS